MLQLSVWAFTVGQVVPPKAAGTVTFCDLVSVPPPQGAEHVELAYSHTQFTGTTSLIQTQN